MEWASVFGLASVPVVVALVGLLRSAGLSAPWSPLAAVAVGVVWNVAVAPLVAGGLYPAALQGVLAGLAAAGLYDLGKHALRGIGPVVGEPPEGAVP